MDKENQELELLNKEVTVIAAKYGKQNRFVTHRIQFVEGKRMESFEAHIDGFNFCSAVNREDVVTLLEIEARNQGMKPVKAIAATAKKTNDEKKVQ